MKIYTRDGWPIESPVETEQRFNELMHVHLAATTQIINEPKLLSNLYVSCVNQPYTPIRTYFMYLPRLYPVQVVDQRQRDLAVAYRDSIVETDAQLRYKRPDGRPWAQALSMELDESYDFVEIAIASGSIGQEMYDTILTLNDRSRELIEAVGA